MLGVEIVRARPARRRTSTRAIGWWRWLPARHAGARRGPEFDSPGAPLVLTRDQADFGLELIEECLTEVCK